MRKQGNGHSKNVSGLSDCKARLRNSSENNRLESDPCTGPLLPETAGPEPSLSSALSPLQAFLQTQGLSPRSKG